MLRRRISMASCLRYEPTIKYVDEQTANDQKDINNSGDGGVYAELIQNRAFQGNAVGEP